MTSDPAEQPVFPDQGRRSDDLRELLAEWQGGDIDWKGGRAFSLVYNAADPELEALQHDVASRFLHENALNPFVYPSLLRMEHEVVSVAAELFGTDPKAGTMSSGGTESIFLAVYTAREEARSRGVDSPQLLLAATAHPAFTKAAHYLGVEEIRVPIGADLRADVDAMASQLTGRTALVVGSAPCYPYGVIDPIADIAAMAADNGILCHVDACLGGWLLPFWQEIGEPVPPWNFAVDGVTSISADIHKYGYCFKGASVIMYRDVAMKRRQHFLFDGWPGGMYGSATTAGTRPAAPIAAAWATIQHLGRDGYLAKARMVKGATAKFLDGVRAIDGLQVSGDPEMSLFEFSSTEGPEATGATGDGMDDRGWHLDRQQGGLHLMVSPGHLAIADQFVADLADAVAQRGANRGVAASYGGVADKG
ncbi:MAG: aspartate aminotransferase family protein [Actinomycetia bacterium]|nr:aspartate aminotransferase family protein [Actinomycetes bacterium]